MRKLKSNLVKLEQSKRLYQIPCPVIGLTGGIGTGKSTVADLFRKKGIPVIDADRLVKNIYQRSETKEFIQKNFPAAVESNEIVFKKLREIVFINADAKKLVEDFIYARMPDEFRKTFDSFSAPEFIVYDVPLLFEKNLHMVVDISVCVYASREIQIERMILRDHISRDLAENILNNQINIEDKKKLADFIIENSEGIDKLQMTFDQFLQEISVH